MTSSSHRIYARILLAGTVGFAALIGHATTAGATTAEPGAVLIAFSVPGGAQIPMTITHTINPATADERATVYDQMLTARDEAAKMACAGTILQIDLGAGEVWEAAEVGKPFPINAEGTLSAITGIVGTGTCDTPPASTPAVDTATDAPLTPAAVVDTPAAPSVPAGEIETGTAIKLQRTGFVVTPMLPNTGSNSGELVLLGLSLIGAGVLVVKLTRRTV